MSHYFTDNKNMPHNRKDYSFRFLSYNFSVVSDDGVFSKTSLDEGTEVLLKEAVKQPITGRVLDLGCGLGIVTMVLKKQFPIIEVTGVDVNSRAIELSILNLKKNQIEGRILLSDGFEEVDESFDWVVSNPPVRVGKEKLYQLFEGVHAHLASHGKFIFVMRKSHGAQSAKKKCEALFGNCEILERSKGYYVLISVKP